MAQRQPDRSSKPGPLRALLDGERSGHPRLMTAWARVTEWLHPHALLVAICTAVTIPLWLVRHPPMQDFPNHVATIKVLHDLGTPGAGLADDYELTLGRTQYIGFYVCGHALAFVLGSRGAALALVALYLVGTIVAVRQLLVVLERDER